MTIRNKRRLDPETSDNQTWNILELGHRPADIETAIPPGNSAAAQRLLELREEQDKDFRGRSGLAPFMLTHIRSYFSVLFRTHPYT